MTVDVNLIDTVTRKPAYKGRFFVDTHGDVFISCDGEQPADFPYFIRLKDGAWFPFDVRYEEVIEGDVVLTF